MTAEQVTEIREISAWVVAFPVRTHTTTGPTLFNARMVTKSSSLLTRIIFSAKASFQIS